jgi:hypothetical protein
MAIQAVPAGRVFVSNWQGERTRQTDVTSKPNQMISHAHSFHQDSPRLQECCIVSLWPSLIFGGGLGVGSHSDHR